MNTSQVVNATQMHDIKVEYLYLFSFSKDKTRPCEMHQTGIEKGCFLQVIRERLQILQSNVLDLTNACLTWVADEVEKALPYLTSVNDDLLRYIESYLQTVSRIEV
ncbi:unnamed protein product [Dibothriocephalus latus]|uniref:Uncharacterized protein n=1 Tax=Dibothriocephalus latus TaxID=60516 RepID=A0A3P6PIS0_DIBLA|nr:unnamed protein product [Dibothriocephalus latus]